MERTNAPKCETGPNGWGALDLLYTRIKATRSIGRSSRSRGGRCKEGKGRALVKKKSNA
jgi:hypothetical protein